MHLPHDEPGLRKNPRLTGNAREVLHMLHALLALLWSRKNGTTVAIGKWCDTQVRAFITISFGGWNI
jgi:hypothetical protein